MLYEVPGGNQVDGLPPVASTSESKLPYGVFGEEYLGEQATVWCVRRGIPAQGIGTRA